MGQCETCTVSILFAQERALLFSRSSIKFQGHAGQKIFDFDPNWAFLDSFTDGYKMMQKAWRSIEEVSYYFPRSNFKVTWDKKIASFDPNWAFPYCNPNFNSLANGFEMMRKAGSSIEEVPYCFSRSFIKSQGHTGQKSIWIWFGQDY